MSDTATVNGIAIGELSRDLAFLTRTIRARMRPAIGELRQEFGVVPGDIGVLRIIGLNPGISQNDLAATVVIKKSAVTKVVRDLMERGLISRQRVRHDKRYNALRLTADGEALVQTLKARVHALYDEWLVGFSPEEQDMLFDLLGRLVDALADRELDPSGSEDD